MSNKFNGCSSCFYSFKDEDAFPCKNCVDKCYYLHKDVYAESQPNKAWDSVVQGLNGTTEEDLDVVNKPKHYMLFKSSDVAVYGLTGRGIEVRDVLEKLVRKMDENWFPYSPLFTSDYVQLMQYLMRFMDKNGVEDLKKARWYLDKLIEAYEDA